MRSGRRGGALPADADEPLRREVVAVMCLDLLGGRHGRSPWSSPNSGRMAAPRSDGHRAERSTWCLPMVEQRGDPSMCGLACMSFLCSMSVHISASGSRLPLRGRALPLPFLVPSRGEARRCSHAIGGCLHTPQSCSFACFLTCGVRLCPCIILIYIYTSTSRQQHQSHATLCLAVALSGRNALPPPQDSRRDDRVEEPHTMPDFGRWQTQQWA